MLYFITGYVEVATDAVITGMRIPLSTPEFNASESHCLLFDYTVTTDTSNLRPVQSLLSVYVRTTRFVYTGRRLWFTNNTGTSHVEIQIWPASTATSFIDFVGTVADPNSTVIKIGSVELRDGLCHATGSTSCSRDDFSCRNGRGCIPRPLTCDGITHCLDESDELLPNCGRHAPI